QAHPPCNPGVHRPNARRDALEAAKRTIPVAPNLSGLALELVDARRPSRRPDGGGRRKDGVDLPGGKERGAMLIEESRQAPVGGVGQAGECISPLAVSDVPCGGSP